MKYPVINGMKECGNCNEVLPLDRFSFTSPRKGHKKGYRSACKKCRSKQVHQKVMERKLEMFPNIYIQCTNESCNYIWDRGRDKWCPKCGHAGESNA